MEYKGCHRVQQDHLCRFFIYSHAPNIRKNILLNVYLDILPLVCHRAENYNPLRVLEGYEVQSVVWFKASEYSDPRWTTEYKGCRCHRVQPGQLCPFFFDSRAPNMRRSALLNVYLDILSFAYHRAEYHNPLRVVEGYKVQISFCGSKQVDTHVPNKETGYKWLSQSPTVLSFAFLFLLPCP